MLILKEVFGARVYYWLLWFPWGAVDESEVQIYKMFQDNVFLILIFVAAAGKLSGV